jgi:hypothetical protein
MTQGARANRSGHVLETTVEGTLQGHKYFKVGAKGRKQQDREYLLTSNLLPKRYARNVYIGTGIYQNDLYADFYIVGSPIISSGLIIECKWQQITGSVDEKYPYLNLNIKESYPDPTIVVIGGKAMRAGAITWFKKQVSCNPNLLAVYDLDSFVAWTNKNL